MGTHLTGNEKAQANTQESYRVSNRGKRAVTLGPEKCKGDALRLGRERGLERKGVCSKSTH